MTDDDVTAIEYEGSKYPTDPQWLLKRSIRLVQKGGLRRFLYNARVYSARQFHLLVPIVPWFYSTFHGRTFEFEGRELDYCYHPYNRSWRTQRALEVPIARTFLNRYDPAETLEVGNVLRHYLDVSHDVVDKYESGEEIKNTDILEYDPDERYRLVLCLTTLEHVGVDEEGESADKAIDALERLIELVKPGGELVVTTRLGYNEALDEAIEDGTVQFDKEHFVYRPQGGVQWAYAESRPEGIRDIETVRVGVQKITV
jgi:hypothetical protein